MQTVETVQIVPLSDNETERLKKNYPTPFVKFGQRFVRTVPGNFLLPAAYEKFKDQIKSFEVRTEDVYVLGFPKNGTTWSQELVWCLQNNCDTEKAKAFSVYKRIQVLDLSFILDFLQNEIGRDLKAYFERMQTMDSPRVFKSHLSFDHLPYDLLEKSKAVMCLRNPKDAIVSLFHHEKVQNLNDYTGDFSTFFELFMDNLVLYTPYFEYIQQLWKRRNHPNMCVLFFEELKVDLAGNIRRVAKFLGKEITDEQVKILVDHLSFEKMKENKSVNHEVYQDGKIMKKEGSFLRKGEVGDWKNYFTDEMNKQMDEAIEKYLKPVGLEFRYE